MESAYDLPIADIARYIFHYEIDEADEKTWAWARLALLDTLGRAIETAATSDECRKLLGLTSGGMIVPDGFRVPGTSLQVDPLEGAFDLGLLIRYLDHNDALGGAEWGHPSDNIAAILAVMGWSSRMAASGRLVHTGPPLPMRTLLIALIKAYEIQGCYQMCNAFNEYGIDHVTMACIFTSGWTDSQQGSIERAITRFLGKVGPPEMLRGELYSLFFMSKRASQAHRGLYRFQFARPFDTWTIQNVLFKAMPVEGHAVSAVEAVLIQLRRCREIGLSNPTQDIKRIDLRTTAAADLIINKKGPLRNAADRDHCIQYVVALAVLKGSAPEAVDYLDTSPWATNEDLKYLMDKISVSPDPVLTRDYLDLDKKSLGTSVTIHLKNQSVVPEILVEYPLGHVRNPGMNAFLEAKFSQNMARMFSARETAQIAEAVHRPDLQVTSLVDLLARPAGQQKL